MTVLEKLFSPLKIGRLVVKNRIVLPPFCTLYASTEGIVTERMINYYAARAKGGAGLITVEYSFVDPMGRGCPVQLGIYDDKCIPGLHDLAESIQAYGAKAVIQIHHVGRETTPSINRAPYIVAPSAIPCELIGVVPKELTIPEIHDIIKAFGEGARRAKAAGFDAVELHGAHGYLMFGFLSPLSNKRNDKYGGLEEGRMRFGLEVLEEVKNRVGDDFPVGYRISGDEFSEGGLTVKEVIKYVKKLEEAEISYVHVSGGTFDSIDHMVASNYYPPANLVHLAAEVKNTVDIPVITVGKILNPVLADKIIGEGKADLVAMGRALFADPELPNKAREGRFEDIIPCINCNHGCLWAFFKNWPTECDVNPKTGREGKYKIIKAQESKKVLIVGGGPGGMEAARVAALRGHEVVLYEKNDKLGGNMIPASIPSFKKEIGNLLDYFKAQIKKLNVKVELGREITPKKIAQNKQDVVIIATGATPLIPEIPGVEKPHVVTATQALEGKVTVKGNVVVAGGGSVGCETALFLAEKGKKVTVVEMTDSIAYDLEPTSSRVAILKKMAEYGIKTLTNAKIDEIKDDSVFVMDKNWKRQTLKSDTVVLAVGMKPRDVLVKALEGKIPELYVIGDCVEPRRIKYAIYEANRVAREI